jgi:hypothetical protein
VSTLEDRIRTGLSADRAVPDVLDAVHEGARRRKGRRKAWAAAAVVLAVAAIVNVISMSVGGKDHSRPVQPAPKPTPSPVVRPTFPGAHESAMSAASAGDRVFVLTQNRTLWTLTDGEWTAQRNLPITKHRYYEIALSPNGSKGVIDPFVFAESETPGSSSPTSSGAVLVTSDGGHTWTRATRPASCGCGATVTDAGFFYLGGDGLYQSRDGLTGWHRTSLGQPPYPGALFARGSALVIHGLGDRFAVSIDDGRGWRWTHACRAAGRGYAPDHDYIFDMGIAAGDEIVVDCSRKGWHQVMHTLDMATFERLGPKFHSASICCYPIADDAAVGAGLLVTSSRTREIELPLEQIKFGSSAIHAGDATYLAFFGQLFVSYDDGLTWTELTR